MQKEILLPKLGMTMEEGTITKWYKKEGDYIKAGELIYELETDKTSLQVESDLSGRLVRILVGESESAPVTSPVAIVEESV